jgi:hypothetical protein
MTRTLFPALALALATSTATAADASRWALDIKGGVFEPDIDGWEEHYGDDRTEHVALAASYLPLSFLELGLEGGRMAARGVGDLQLNNTTGGTVTSEFFPLHVSVTLRGQFTSSQWIVPFVGGGYTRLYYRQRVIGESKAEGSVNGSHLRAGLLLLLDSLDRADARNLQRMGIEHSYLTLEVQQLNAKEETTDTDLGGRSGLIGLRIEF